MDQANTAPSIQRRDLAQVAADDDAFGERASTSSTPLSGQSGAQTPLLDPPAATLPQQQQQQQPSMTMPANDELERFRSEWKKEVEARGHLSYAQPPSASSSTQQSSAQAQSSTSTSTHQVQAGNPTSAISTGLESAAPDDDAKNDFLDEQDDGTLQLNDDALPAFPEAAIYAPAALKYSKGAHRMPRPISQQSHTDLPAPIIPPEYHPSLSASTSASSGSVANGVSHALRDRIRAGGPSTTSISTSTSRPLGPQAQASSSSFPSSRPPRIMATPDAPALASQATQAGMRSAVEAYAHAVEMERSGQLDQALASYRRAFKLNSNADRLYHRAHLLLTDPALANTSTQQNDALLSSPAIADKVRKALDFDDHRYVAIKERQAKDAEARARGEPLSSTVDAKFAPEAAEPGDKAARISEARPDELAKLLDNLSIERGGERDFGLVAFQPEDEEKSMPIARLPDEVLLHILRMVIAPRGRRGAKVVKPKPTPEEQAALDAATAALTGRGGVKGAAGKADAAKSGKGNADAIATAPTTAANGVKNEIKATTAANGKDAPAANTAETPANGDKASTDGSTTAIVATTRKQPLGIGVVLGGSDWQSLEIAGRTCWKMRLLTKSPSLWREIVRETYYPPILDPALSLTTLYERNHWDWRTAFINQPRVRLNGCYIAACHYARPGLSEDAWVRVIHVVEFYRSIRFLPDGTALSLLTTDPPSETVRRLEPSLKAKGFAKGRWELFEHGLEDDDEEGRPRGAKVVVEDLRDRSMHKYAFRMVFGLRSTTRGRWNKLDLLEYHSVNLTNGEVLPLPQKHSRPFHFSRVIAYGV